MIAAEKWYEYQADYKRYGFAMKAETAPVKKEEARSESTMKAKDKMRLLMLIFVTGALLIGLIIVTAYGAKLQYNTNKLISEADQIQRDIDNINVEIRSACGIGTIETRAAQELGMVYPGTGSITYVQSEDQSDAQLAQSLKEVAYSGQ